MTRRIPRRSKRLNAMPEKHPVYGAGLGLRRAFIGPLADSFPAGIDFMEVVPENWIAVCMAALTMRQWET